MLQYIARRILYMIPTLFFISVVTFVIIQLPPGDYLTTLVSGMAQQGETVSPEALQALEEQYGLGQPIHVQYWKWISGIIMHGDFGRSFEWNRPVSDLIWNRLGFTLLLSLSTLIFSWLVALAFGIYSAVNQYSIGDHVVSFIGFFGLATPDFMLALVLMYVAFRFFGQSVGGLFSPEYAEAPWSWGKFLDLLAHLWIPIIIIGTSGITSLMRTMRANLLDELRKPYVVTARARGLSERKLLMRYPVRLALNPFVSTAGWALPGLISGEVIVAVVLSLPTTGPLLLRALQSQDMYLAGSFIMMLSVLSVIGTLLSDIALAWLDPRIRYQ